MDAPSWLRWLARPMALLLVPLLAAATYAGAWAVTGDPPFFASGCDPAARPAGSPSASPDQTGTQADARLSLDFGFQPDPLQPRAPVTWRFSVANNSAEPVTLTFASGQSGDVVLVQNGVERYRWSEGQVFTQAIRTQDIAAGESWTFTLEGALSVEAGSYEVSAWVTSDPAPARVIRTLTVGTPPSPDPTPSDTPTDPSTDEPDDGSSPSPAETKSTPPPESPSPTSSSRARPRRRRARARSGRRMRIAFVTLAVWSALTGGAFAQDAGSGGKNVVIAINQTDERTAARSGVAVGRAAGPSVVPENLASARSSCTDCRTVAVAMQAVIITSDPDVASPRNAAGAVNAGCTRCETLAYAWQYVISTGTAVRITPEGEQAIADVRREAFAAAARDAPLAELVAQFDQLAARLREIVDTEVRTVGRDPARQVDLKRTC